MQAADAEVTMLVFLLSLSRYESASVSSLLQQSHSLGAMAGTLPVELVGEIWRAAAELFIETDHRTVLDIAASCTIGYHAVTPVLYRTLLMKDDGTELIMRVFSTETIAGAPTLSAPPTQRLCPLVRRICAFNNQNFDPDKLKHLTRLEIISNSHETFFLAPLASTLTHLSVWDADWPERLPTTLTHVSLYCYLGDDVVVRRTELRSMADTLPNSVTHFALMFCYAFPRDAAERLQALIPLVLAREGIKTFGIRLLGDAANDSNYQYLLRVVAGLQSGDRNRVRLWRDMRNAFSPNSGLLAAGIKTDVVVGRTLWTEARPIMQEELIKYLNN